MRAFVSLAGVSLLLASASFAQDGSEGSASRTPESANRFLYTVFSQDDAGAFSYDVLVKDGSIVDDNAIGATTKPVDGRLEVLTADGPCKSRLRLRDAQVADGSFWNVGPFERTIDWGKVSAVEKTHVVITETYGPKEQPTGTRERTLKGLRLKMRNNWQEIRFSTPSEEERDRAVFAVEFLRQGCAVASDTGF